MEDIYFKRIMTFVILVVLVGLSFLLLQPILLAIIVGIILAFIFTPVYNWVYKKIKLKNVSAGLICILLIILIVLPLWFLTPIAIDQSFKVYLSVQKIDFVTPLKTIFPSLFVSDEFSAEIGGILSSFVTQTSNSLINYFSDLILNFPTLMLKLFVVLFTFYFVLRDQRKLLDYIKSLLPFGKEVQKKLFDYSKGITVSVIYGQVIVGIIQGFVLGIGLFIFGIPNALLLTLFAALAAMFPIIGTFVVWLPLVIYLFIAGSTFPAVGILIFGLLSSSIDNLLRPLIVARRTSIHSSIILVGMVGGFFLFGILGLILGPLILSYLLVILELYRNKKSPELFIKK